MLQYKALLIVYWLLRKTSPGYGLLESCLPLKHPTVQCFQPILDLGFRPSTRGRGRRSLELIDSYELDFQAFDKHFHLKLSRNNMLVDRSLNIEVIGNSGKRQDTIERLQPHNHLYTGFLVGEPSSHVHGWYDKSQTEFDGIILTDNTYFYIEPSRKYLNGTFSKTFKSIIYRDSDLHLHISPPAKCGVKASKVSSMLFSLNVSEVRVKRMSFKSNMACSLHAIADHLFFEYVGQKSLAITIHEMVYNVAVANAIFRSTDFDGDGDEDHIGIKIAKMSVYETNKFHVKDEPTPEEFLSTIAINHKFDDYCLGLFFTYREFIDSVIGLAYRGSSTEDYGGICSKSFTHANGKVESFNAAFVSNLNFGEKISRQMSSITVAHELGHAFGSPHDGTKESASPTCTPGTAAGNYLMHTFAGTGEKPNHKIFSPCSLMKIRPVMLKRASLCFLEDSVATCGNGVKEPGEECDCGDETQCDFIDPCCVPNDSQEGTPCKLKPNKDCSGTSRCCDPNSCKVIPAEARVVCETEQPCMGKSFCNGLSANCPKPKPLQNGSPCARGTKLCSGGSCNQTLCTNVECQCMDAEENYCVLCCADASGKCEPYLTNTTGVAKKVHLRNGHLCRQNTGFCDVHGKCHHAALLQSRFLGLFSNEGLTKVKEWFTTHWYVVALLVLVVTIGIIIFRFHFSKESENIHALAFQMGNIARIWVEANRQHHLVQNRLEIVSRLGYEPAQNRGCVSGLARLKSFFPSLSSGKLAEVVKKSASEEFAVRTILMEGHTLKKFSQGSVHL